MLTDLQHNHPTEEDSKKYKICVSLQYSALFFVEKDSAN